MVLLSQNVRFLCYSYLTIFSKACTFNKKLLFFHIAFSQTGKHTFEESDTEYLGTGHKVTAGVGPN